MTILRANRRRLGPVLFVAALCAGCSSDSTSSTVPTSGASPVSSVATTNVALEVQPVATITATVDSCPQPDFEVTRYHTGPPATCDVAWMLAGQQSDVSCYVEPGEEWVYTKWYWRATDGWYVADGTVEISDEVPQC